MRAHRGLFVPLFLFAMAIAFISCNDKGTTTGLDFVTISGVVANVDTGLPAVGVHVWLLDTDFEASAATGTDGAFDIQVPKNSRLLLITDDTDPQQDAWFPTINTEHPRQLATANRQDWLIHACPNSHVPELGSVAAWDNYLQNGDPANGGLFDPDSSAAATGVIAMLFFETNSGLLRGLSGIRVTTDAPSFPLGYIRNGGFWSPTLTPDWNQGPDMMWPADTTKTDCAAAVLGFGDDSFTGKTVVLTIIDTDPARAYAFESPYDVPVRPGTITLTLPSAIDGVENQPFGEMAATITGFSTELQACLSP